MRFEHTPALTFALQRAAGYALRAGADAIAPLHLLLGLLAEEEGQPAVLLASAGVGRAELCQRLGLLEDAPADPEEMALHPDTLAILRGARELAMLHSAEGTLSSDQVLLALIDTSEELRGRLREMGLDTGRLLG
jgi:ATP-dependent Clp protease ATP-binding subunit ClpA